MELDRFFAYLAFNIIGEVTFPKPFGFMDHGEDVGSDVASNMGLQHFLCTLGFYQGLSYPAQQPARDVAAGPPGRPHREYRRRGPEEAPGGPGRAI